MSNPPRSIIKVFAALPWAAGDARTFTGRVLRAWGLADLTDTATLLVSELITNAVKHAGGVTDSPMPAGLDVLTRQGKTPPVMLSLAVLDVLRIEVWDHSTDPPVRREAADDEVSGRGLELVEALSKEWGYENLKTGGKIIWSAIELGDEQ